jgi:hypothetical protein
MTRRNGINEEGRKAGKDKSIETVARKMGSG